jgi:polygalacturonase
MVKLSKWWLGAALVVTSFGATAQVRPIVKQVSFKTDTFNIIKYGAIADGKTLNTESINKTIDICSQSGGGVVLVPAGLWISGPIVLKSNVNLHLEYNALIQFTKDFSQYPLVQGNWEGLPQWRAQSPISAENVENIAITGKGIIDGAGEAWRQVKKGKFTESQWKNLIKSGGVLNDKKDTWYPTERALKGSKEAANPGEINPSKGKEYYESIKEFLRPNLLVITKSKRILLEGVTFQNSPAWCLHPLMSEDITIREILVKNPWYAQNGDGLDLESCKNVLIENSIFDVGDDALCMKSGRDAAGRERGMPTENVIIKNCTVYQAHGGFVIGSEMSGGARNIFVDNCTFIGTDIGLRFKTARGRGGIVENIYINNIYMKDIPGEAILFDMYYMARDPVPMAGEQRAEPVVETKPVDETTPQFRNFHIKNVVCNGAETGIFLRGVPEMQVKNIVLEDMVIQAHKGMVLNEAKNITFKNIELVVSEGKEPVVDVYNSSDLKFENFKYNGKPELLFRVGGAKSKDIQVRKTKVNAVQPLVLEFNAPAKAVKFK